MPLRNMTFSRACGGRCLTSQRGSSNVQCGQSAEYSRILSHSIHSSARVNSVLSSG